MIGVADQKVLRLYVSRAMKADVICFYFERFVGEFDTSSYLKEDGDLSPSVT